MQDDFRRQAFICSHRSSNIRSQVGNRRLICMRLNVASYPNVSFSLILQIIERVAEYAIQAQGGT